MDHDHSLKPIATCVRSNCRDCRLQGLIHCHFDLFDLAKFILAVLPSFILGALGIRMIDSNLILPWVVLCVGFFGFVEIKILCSHCPHYAEPGNFLRCWANHGSPKLWKYRPGPLSPIEKIVLLGGFGMVWGYPLVFLILGGGFVVTYSICAVKYWFLCDPQVKILFKMYELCLPIKWCNQRGEGTIL